MDTFWSKVDKSGECWLWTGYIGESTRGEIDYAVAHGKPVDYLEPLAALASPDKGEPLP